MTDRVDRVIDVLAAVADHRYTILAGWLSPAIVVLAAPDRLVQPLLFALMGVVLIMHQAQMAVRGPT